MDAKYCHKTALHCAAAAGKVNVVEALLELQANIESKVSSPFWLVFNIDIHVHDYYRMRKASLHFTIVQ